MQGAIRNRHHRFVGGVHARLAPSRFLCLRVISKDFCSVLFFVLYRDRLRQRLYQTFTSNGLIRAADTRRHNLDHPAVAALQVTEDLEQLVCMWIAFVAQHAHEALRW
jgi:hypothetical protein